MAGQLTPVGRAVATAKGHYPTADGHHVVRLPGETFTVFAGWDKAKWFTRLEDGVPTPSAAPAAAPAEPVTLAGAAKVERERKARVKPPMADDLV